MARASDPTRERLRWDAVDGQRRQETLFDSDAERVTHPEFRDLEFVHVRAKSIINTLPESASLPFRHTINVYRGCSHACVYCLHGDTPILMADGRTKRLAEIEIGDAVYGTVRRGAYRRYVTTRVLDHWSTVKEAYRVVLEDGTELVASGDHRFLTDRGWKPVMTGAQHGGVPRAHLTTGDRLIGPGSSREPGDGTGLRTDVALAIRSVEPVGAELPLYDITTGTGDFIANGVVSHNCFARPTHEYLNLDAGRDFERVIVVKVNAVAVLRAELRRGWPGEHIAMGTNTDPYQRAEGRYRLTRGVIGALTAAANPFSVLTKSPLVLRDLDLLREANARTDIAVNFSVGTLDTEVWKRSEPAAPHPMKRIEAVAALREAGIASGVLIAPVLPGISDAPAQLEAVVQAALDAGAVSVSPILLHLRPGVKEVFLPWLEDRYPDLADRYERLYPRSYASSRERRNLGERVRRLVEDRGGMATAKSPTDARNVRGRTRAVESHRPPQVEQPRLPLWPRPSDGVSPPRAPAP